jgi:response regulator of citrate/malate metabolism
MNRAASSVLARGFGPPGARSAPVKSPCATRTIATLTLAVVAPIRYTTHTGNTDDKGNQMLTKTALRKAVGRGRFTVADLAEAQGTARVTARQKLAKLEAEGLVERVGTRKVTTESGEFGRGRPATIYKVASGK